MSTAGQTYYARHRERIQARKQARRRVERLARMEREAAQCFYCPDDPKLLVPLWNKGAILARGQFIDTLGGAFFPENSVWQFAVDPHDEPRLWQVRGPELHAADSDEVVRAVENTKQQVKLVSE